MGLLQEFKAFALKGNVVDMAVGVIIGGAFGKIVTSLVNDIIMPPIGVLVGGVDFKDLSLTIKKAVPAIEAQEAVKDEAGNIIKAAVEAVEGSPEVVLSYGNFLQVTIDFLIVAISVFIMIKIFNKLSSIRIRKEKEEAAAAATPAPEPAPTKEEVLLTEIRDILKNK